MSTQFQSQDLEKYFVAGLLKYPEVFQLSIVQIQAHYFQHHAYQILFEIIAEKIKNNLKFDSMLLKQSVTDKYPNMAWNDCFYGLSQCQTEASKIEDCIALIEEAYLQRQLLEIAQDLSNPQELIEQRIDNALLGLVKIKQQSKAQYAPFFSGLLLSQLDEIVQGKSAHTLFTGFPALDKLMGGGLEPGQLCVIGARSGMGKTRLLLSMFKNMLVKQQKNALFLSYHMTAARFLNAYLHGVPIEHQVDFEMPSADSLNNEIEQLNQLEKLGRFRFCNLLESNEKHLMTSLLKHVVANKIDVVMIDSIQFLQQNSSGNFTTRDKYIGLILKELKRLATVYQFTLIVGSEISRNAEKRSFANRPMLSDLKDSGWIEELADQVLFLYRPSYYHLCEWEDGTNAQNQAELILAKNNRFLTGSVRISYDEHGRFSNMVTDDIKIPHSRLKEL
jgi:replicative DNA helicase